MESRAEFVAIGQRDGAGTEDGRLGRWLRTIGGADRRAVTQRVAGDEQDDRVEFSHG